MGDIRPLERADLPQVESLHERVARSRSRTLTPGLARHLEKIFFDYPWADPELRPLVYVDEEGTVGGVIGSSVRRMTLDGRPIRMRISSHFLIEPEARSRGSGILLLRECLDGPQDLTVTDTATELSQRLWERLGGRTSHVSCFGWVRVFRPWRFTRTFFSSRRRLRPLALATAPLAPALDLVSVRVAPSALRPTPPPARAEELTPSALAEHIPAVARSFRLRPAYEDGEFVRWLFDAMAEVWHPRSVVARLVRKGEQVQGWYVYVLKPGEIAQALQIVADEGGVEDVLDHLFHDAWSRGASALQGRVEARLLEPLSRRRCLFHVSGSRALFHSRSPEVLDAIESGRALLTRMEADWWIYGPWWDPVVG